MRPEPPGNFRSARAWAFPGLAEPTAPAGIVTLVWRISAIRPPLLATPLTSASLAVNALKFWTCEVYGSARGAPHRQLATSLGAAWVGSETARPPPVLD